VVLICISIANTAVTMKMNANIVLECILYC
jgi:hypothetical protein